MNYNKLKFNLTNEQAIMLDGHVDKKEQSLINLAKLRIQFKKKYPENDKAWFVADLIHEAKKNGIVTFKYGCGKFCCLCDKKASYAKYTRNSRYHKKGQLNYDKLIPISLIEFHDAYIKFQNHVTLGCCNDCWQIIKPIAKKHLNKIKAEISTKICPNNKYKRFLIQQCKECNSEFTDYFHKCPKCQTKRSIKYTKNFIIK